MNVMKLLVVLCVVLGLYQTPSAQQLVKFRGSDGWGHDSRYEQLFSGFDLQTYIGDVVRIDTVTPMQDMGVGIQIVLDYESEKIPVHLGPAWYILNQDINFPQDKEIEVRGCSAFYSSSEFIMPVEIRLKDRILRLRDEEGYPLWNVIRDD
ncbi:MAG: hypothetical protein ACLFQB_00555 [Chitinispirillaceae bacterium]